MKRLACASLITLVSSIFLVQQGSPATRNELITALDAYEHAITDKLNSDLETIARAFSDAKDIQKARRWADWAKAALSIISIAIDLHSTNIKSPGDIISDLVQAKGQLELVGYFFKLHTLVESVQGLKLAISGPEYDAAVSAMLADADATNIQVDYQNTILLYLQGLSGKKSPVPLVIKSAQGEEVLYGIKEFKTRLSALLADSKGVAASFFSVSEPQIMSLIEQIGLTTSKITQSKSQQVELDIGVTLGRINSLEVIRDEALTQYDQDIKIEQVNTVTSTTDDICKLTTFYLTAGVPVGSSRACDIVSGVSTLSDAITLRYQTSARAQVDQLPFEMLLSLSGEVAGLWNNIQHISTLILRVAVEHNIRPCHTFIFGSTIPQGFGVPWDVFNSGQLLLKAFCTSSSVTADVGPATYVYNQGYAFVNNQWQQTRFSCTGGTLVSDAWCPTSASATLPNSSTYYVAYACNWTGTKWNCGCADTTCSQGFWQLQGIQR